MIGLVLWYKSEAGVGMVWCEDQGPLAFIGPDVSLPCDVAGLHCGDQLVFSFELLDGVRYVRDILTLTEGTGCEKPDEIIAQYHEARERERTFRVVA